MTVVAWGAMLHEAKTACAQAAEKDQRELIDPRTLLPFDIETVVAASRSGPPRGRPRGAQDVRLRRGDHGDGDRKGVLPPRSPTGPRHRV